MSELWERREAESPRAYAAFRAYRDLGPARTLGAVDGSANTVARWAKIHRWAERAQAWDAETYRLEDARRLELAGQMNENHLRVGRFLIAEGLKAINAPGVELTPHQAARYVDLGTRIERAVVLGERLTPPGGPPADDELSPLERIARELGSTA